MAAIGHDDGGRRRVLFVAKDGSRKTVRLGEISERDAEQICRHIEALNTASITGQSAPRDTAVWLTGIGDALHDRLARAGLVEPKEKPSAMALGAFIDEYIGHRPDLKPTTITVLKQSLF